MSKQCFWYLEEMNLMPMVDPQKAEGAREALTHKRFKKGASIYMPTEFADKVYFITEGRVKIGNYSEGGKEIIKAILGRGEVFGELALVDDHPRRDFAIAMEETVLCIMTVEEMKGLMKDHSAIGMFLMKLMGSRVLQMEQRLESLVFKDSRTRIIEFLIQLVTTKGQRVGYEMLVRKFMTHQDIANMTATSRQTVTTVLNDLRNKNILTFNRRRLLVRDMEKLKTERLAMS